MEFLVRSDLPLTYSDFIEKTETRDKSYKKTCKTFVPETPVPYIQLRIVYMHIEFQVLMKREKKIK